MRAIERTKVILERRDKQSDTARLWCKDAWKTFDVFRVPVEALMLHIDNHRFQAERKLVEARLGRALDPENIPEDESAVVAILLDNDLQVEGERVVGKATKDTDALRNDWEARGQETPFWIRPDGTVRNGNRRLAMLKRLREEKGIEGHEFVNAVILEEKDVNERDLFEMEQREQLTENLKIRYTDVNLLLTLKAAADSRGIDWADGASIERVAGELQHATKGNKAYAAIQLRAIKYMDLFLAEANKAGKYEDLLGQVERFRDVGKVMFRMEADHPDEATDMLQLMFAAIRAGAKYQHIRALGKIFIEDRARFNRLLAGVIKDEEEWEKAVGNSRLEEPKVVTKASDNDDSEEESEDVPGPVIPNYPGERVQAKIVNAIDGYLSAQLDLATVLEQAYGRLEPLDTKKLKQAVAGEQGAEVTSSLAKLIEWADRAKSVLK